MQTEEVFTEERSRIYHFKGRAVRGSLLLKQLYSNINLSGAIKSNVPRRAESLLWGPAVSISLINKTQQFGAIAHTHTHTLMQMTLQTGAFPQGEEGNWD